MFFEEVVMASSQKRLDQINEEKLWQTAHYSEGDRVCVDYHKSEVTGTVVQARKNIYGRYNYKVKFDKPVIFYKRAGRSRTDRKRITMESDEILLEFLHRISDPDTV